MHVGPFLLTRERDGWWVLDSDRPLVYGYAPTLRGVIRDYITSRRELRVLERRDRRR